MPDGVRQDAGPAGCDGELERQFQDGPLRTAHHADMTLAEVMRAVPATSRRARDQLQALQAGLACPDLDDVGGKRRDKLEQFWRVHVLHASWGGEGKAPRAVSSPGRDRACELIRDRKTGKPISHTTYKRLRRWWEARGYLAIVREGWTPDLSPGVLRSPGRDHNMTQAYVLCVPRRAALTAMRRGRRPAQPENGPLSGFSKSEGSHARAREGNPGNESFASCCYPASRTQSKRTKGSSREGVLLVGVLARVTDGWWAHLTRLFADLTAPELLWVIDHQPDGTPHLGTDDHVRYPAGWLRHRFSFWLNPDGTRKPVPCEQAAERARIHRQQQAEQRAEAQRAAAAAATAEAQRAAAAAAAEMLAASSAAAAKVMARAAAQHPAATGIPAPRPAAAQSFTGQARPDGATSRETPTGRASLASLARELHRLKQAGQLDTKNRAAAVSAWEARRRAPGPAQETTEPPSSAQPLAAAEAPMQGGTGGYRPTPEYEAAVAIAIANVATWEASRRADAEPPGDRGNAKDSPSQQPRQAAAPRHGGS